MGTFFSYFPPLLVGLMFTAFGCLKFYGFIRGVEGGHEKPTFQQLCGT